MEDQNHCNRATGAPSETRILYQKEGGDDHADDSCGGDNRFPFLIPSRTAPQQKANTSQRTHTFRARDNMQPGVPSQKMKAGGI